mgnify:CR=1 FL=1|tara:strand:- start:46151 stop:46567 length:417 start_codon:yes stop_codon:yes gene_type:complete
MSSLKRKHVIDLAKSLLFENNLNEFRLPLDHDMDAGKNMRHSMFDRPADKIDGQNNYDSVADDEDIFELPITPNEVMPAIHVEKIDSASIESEDYCPSNTSELMKATQTLIHNHKKDIGDKQIKQVWKVLNKIIDKVK